MFIAELFDRAIPTDMGLIEFDRTLVFQSDDDVNEWLEENPNWGVVTTFGDLVFVAHKTDLGKRREKEAA